MLTKMIYKYTTHTILVKVWYSDVFLYLGPLCPLKINDDSFLFQATLNKVQCNRPVNPRRIVVGGAQNVGAWRIIPPIRLYLRPLLLARVVEGVAGGGAAVPKIRSSLG